MTLARVVFKGFLSNHWNNAVGASFHDLIRSSMLSAAHITYNVYTTCDKE